MIVYKNVLAKLKDAGYTTTRIRKEKLISESILTKLRHNRPVSTETLDLICQITGLEIGEIIEYVDK